jgi:hypothetical protein
MHILPILIYIVSSGGMTIKQPEQLLTKTVLQCNMLFYYANDNTVSFVYLFAIWIFRFILYPFTSFDQ